MPGLAGRELGQERGPGNAWWAAMGRVRRMGGAPPQCPPIGRSAPACRVRAAPAAARTGAGGWTASAAARMANLAAPQTSPKNPDGHLKLLPRRMAEDGRWRGDVRPARQASRRPPPVLPRSTRNGSRSVLVSLVSDSQDTPSECPPSCAPSRGPDGTGAAGSCVEVSPPEPSLRRLSRIIRAFDRTHSRA